MTTNYRSAPTMRMRLRYMMEFGLLLGVYLSVHFTLLLLPQLGIISLLLFFVMLCALPFGVVLLARKYRDKYYGGRMTYMEAVSLLSGSLLCAMIVFAVAAYFGISHMLQQPQVVETLQQMVNTWQAMPGLSAEQKEAFGNVLYMTPKDFTLQMLVSYIFFGFIFNYIAAFFVRK